MKNTPFLILFLLCGWGMRSQDLSADFLTAEIDIHPIPQDQSIMGRVHYTFMAGAAADSLYIDARDMDFTTVRIDGEEVPFSYDRAVLSVAAPLAPGRHTWSIVYQCQPSQTVYFIGWEDDVEGNEQVWTQGQGKYSSHWVPSFDEMQEKVVFNLKVRTDPQYEVVANGRQTRRYLEEGQQVWEYTMQAPMSSYLLAFALGAFAFTKEVSSSGVPLKWYYPKGEGEKASATYRYSREVFDFLEEEIGRPYPWQDYKQVPVSDFMYAGMENTGATFFSDAYLTDSIGQVDMLYLGVDAHELAHQWFGNLVTETGGASHWLHEGFAQYYAYLAQEQILGSEAVAWKLYTSARQLGGQDEKGEGTALTDPGSNSLVFYEKGAWALVALRDMLGDETYRDGIRAYLDAFAYRNADVDAFLRVMEGVSGRSLAEYRETWLDSATFPMAWVRGYLSKYTSIEYFMGLRASGLPSGGIREAWNASALPQYRVALLQEFGASFSRTDFERAFAVPDIEVRKAVLTALGTLPDWSMDWAKPQLDAPSYDLRQRTLLSLWAADPAGRTRYLEATEQNGSFTSLEFRQLWWFLAVFTEGFRTAGQKAGYLESLRNTTAAGYPVEARIQAFQMLQEVDAMAGANYRDLVRATVHHNWRFRIFARRFFDDLVASRPQEAFWKNALEGMRLSDFPYVNHKLQTL